MRTALCLVLALASAQAEETALPSSVPGLTSNPDWDGSQAAGENRADVQPQENPPSRDFRQITGEPTYPFPSPVPISLFDIQYPLLGTPLGGYYYGFFQAPDGHIFYGKLYVPQYGDFDGAAHNNPCPCFYLCRCLFYGSCPIYYLFIPRPRTSSGFKIPVQSY